MDYFLHYLNSISPLTQDEQNAISHKLVKTTYPKYHTLITELSTCESLYFIEKGLARAFYIKDGRDITDWFAPENSVIGPVIRNFPVKEGPHAVELLESSSVISIRFADLQELYDKHHAIERLGRVIAIQTIMALQRRIDAIQFLNAKSRYEDFMSMYPSLLQRVSLGHIASYLGMNQVTLSRVRKSK